jgi:hypothetical protein
MNTLSSIAIEAGKTKRTVQGWVSSLESQKGIKLGTMEGNVKTFTDAEKAMILDCAPPREAVQAKEVHVEVGNHSIVVAAPSLPTEFNLESLRGDVEIVELDDPMAIVEQFAAIADQVHGAMRADVERKKKKLEQTREASRQLGDLIAATRMEQRIYQMETSTLGETVTAETERLQKAAQELGKLRSE